MLVTTYITDLNGVVFIYPVVHLYVKNRDTNEYNSLNDVQNLIPTELLNLYVFNAQIQSCAIKPEVKFRYIQYTLIDSYRLEFPLPFSSYSNIKEIFENFNATDIKLFGEHLPPLITGRA